MSALMRRPLPRADVRHRPIGAGYPVWVFFAQLSFVRFMFVDFGTVHGLNPQPQFLLSLVIGLPMVVLAPRGTFARTRVSLTVVLFFTWWTLSYVWSTLRVTWVSESMTVFASIMALTMIASALPMEHLRSVWLNTLYAMVAYTFLFTAAKPSSTVLANDTTGGIANVGWHGPFNHKNNLASFMIVGMVVVLSLERVTWRRRTAVGLMFLLVLLTRSGTGGGAMFATLAVYVIAGRYAKQSTRRGGAMLAMSVLLSIVAISAASLIVPSILQLYGKDPTLTGRTKIWSSVLTAIRAKPLTGYGFGGVWVDPSKEPTRSILHRIGFVVFHSHNGALELMIELGIIGLVLYFGVFIAVLDGGCRILRANPAIGRLVLAYCMFVFISSFTEVLTLGPWLSLLVFLRVLSLRLLSEDPSG